MWVGLCEVIIIFALHFRIAPQFYSLKTFDTFCVCLDINIEFNFRFVMLRCCEINNEMTSMQRHESISLADQLGVIEMLVSSRTPRIWRHRYLPVLPEPVKKRKALQVHNTSARIMSYPWRFCGLITPLCKQFLHTLLFWAISYSYSKLIQCHSHSQPIK